MSTDIDAADKSFFYRWLLLAGLGSLLLRVWIGISFPITGDEAFFYWWGVYPDWGYSDHPPMVGWLIALMRATFGDGILSVRLPVILLPLGVGAALWWGLKGINRQRAAWAVLLFWLAPLNWLNTLITTDTPLIFWSAWSVAALLRAEQRIKMDRATFGLYALSGLFLGAAFLSKYFAVVLGLAYVMYFLLYRRDRLLGFALLVLCALPGPGINIAYNMSHGWANIMFNVYNRNSAEVFEWRKPLLYLLTMAYLITPVCLWLGYKYRKALSSTAKAIPAQRLLACVVLVPLIFFAVLSFKKVIGLHWVLAFYPFGFAWLAFSLPADEFKACTKGLAWFAGLHVLLVAGLYMTSVSDWKNTKLYPQIVRSYKTAEMMAQVQSPGVTLMGEAFTPASIFGFQLRQYMPVFGLGKFHSRQDDQLIDFSFYQGKTIRVITADPPQLDQFKPYFERVEVLKFEQSGVPFYALEGHGFNYPAYREGVLGAIFKNFYGIPSFLPMTGCAFCERYCGKVRCQ
ncbi:hypothetical protein HC248_03161 [Polaromonas vacuolata]|uniref:Glycosyltransferase RgtA/B/C/D-like domain-containing protein n=1 Tax=Polaromonas vacuolata TaxID=37448 RepID=A0A6H2HDC2_9BURK|nr:glycosyltransferase family 39 protein [Polaromonas vacuolata]QJC57830.1 hypothetical protein HC248_03161 [Polaromonas vacuolata]